MSIEPEINLIKLRKNGSDLNNPFFSANSQKEHGPVISYVKERKEIEEINQIDWSSSNIYFPETKRKEIITAIHEWYKGKKESCLKEAGMDIESAKDYIEKLGLIFPQEVVLFNNQEIKEIDQIISNITNYSGVFDFSEIFTALYHRGVDMVFINVDSVGSFEIESEKKLWLEAAVVHEVLHQNKGVQNTAYQHTKDDEGMSDLQLTSLRTGFITSKLGGESQGEFIEEGFVRRFQKEYVNSKRLPDITKKIIELRNNKYSQEDNDHRYLDSGYLYLENKEKLHEENMTYSDYSGASIDLLISINPQLESNMLDFRKTGEGTYLRQMIQIINEIESGLYSKMKQLSYDEDVLLQDWYEMFKHIKYLFELKNKN